MGWTKTSNVFVNATTGDWKNFVMTVQDCTPESARRIAFKNPKITYFFFCRETLAVNPNAIFLKNDAVFFAGEPQPDNEHLSADLYVKKGVAVAYINPPEGSNTFDDIPAAVDVVCLFAGNYVKNQSPMLGADNNPKAKEPLNPNILAVLETNSVKSLQEKGITVLLTILNGHTEVGWSEFNPEENGHESAAQKFVNYLKSDIVDKYGLDGIDIDDEYSEGIPNNQSLAMVSTLYKQTMPDKLLTKALWSDSEYFSANWNGNTLGKNLDYGWEMSYYFGGPDARLQPYLQYGMSKKVLCLGFSAEDRFKYDFNAIGPMMKKVMDDDYAGGMLFDYSNHPKLMDGITQYTS